MQFLIIGGDSTIGKRISEQLEAEGYNVITTTRKRENVTGTCLYLDLAKNVDMWPIPESIDVAFVCAAVTSQFQCSKNPAMTWRINVFNTSLLGLRLGSLGIFVVFPSTNLVFDGEIPNCPASSIFNPLTVYGRQKMEAEIILKSLGVNGAIVRLTKVLTENLHILAKWRNQLQTGDVIRPFNDMIFSPLLLDFVVEALVTIGKKRLSGIYQISADKDISYAELAFFWAQSIGADPNLVRPIKARAFNINLEHLPKHTTLDTSRMIQKLGIERPAAWEVVHQVLQDGDEFLRE